MDEGEDEEEAHAVHKPERMYYKLNSLGFKLKVRRSNLKSKRYIRKTFS